MSSAIREVFVRKDRRRERYRLTPVGYLAGGLLLMLVVSLTYGGFSWLYTWRTGEFTHLAEPTPASATSPQGLVTATRLNVREGPAKAFEVRSTVYKAEKLKLEGRVGNWFLVTAPDGTKGWVHGESVDVDEQMEEKVPNQPVQHSLEAEDWLSRCWMSPDFDREISEIGKYFMNVERQEFYPGGERQGKYVYDPKALNVLREYLKEQHNEGKYWKTTFPTHTVEFLSYHEKGELGIAYVKIANHFPQGRIDRCYSRETHDLVEEIKRPPGWKETRMFYDAEDGRWKIGDMVSWRKYENLPTNGQEGRKKDE